VATKANPHFLPFSFVSGNPWLSSRETAFETILRVVAFYGNNWIFKFTDADWEKK
jgi:hypothetical protein